MEKNYRELYEKITSSDWFKNAYHNKSLGECPIIVEELEESEDEKTRKWLIEELRIHYDFESPDLNPMVKKALAYLEKQKEQKSINESNLHEPTLGEAREWNEAYEKGYSLGYENGRNEQKPAEWSEADDAIHTRVLGPLGKVFMGVLPTKPSQEDAEKNWIPKFKVGDLFIYNGMCQEAKIYKIKRLVQHGCVAGYWCEQFGAPINGNVWFSSFEEKYMEPEPEEEWSEETQKDIDAAAEYLRAYANNFVQGGNSKRYVLDLADRIELLTPESMPEWSEEDETHRAFILESLEDQIRFCKKDAEGAHYTKQIRTAQNWLKSFPLNLKKKNEDVAKLCSNEWSEEDAKVLNDIIVFVSGYADKRVVSRWVKFLKSLRPQLKQELSIEKAIQWFKDTFFFQNNSSGRGEDYEITTHDFDSMEEMFESFRKSIIVES